MTGFRFGASDFTSRRNAQSPDGSCAPPGELTGYSRSEIDAAKGVLICLIVLGHNTIAQSVWPMLWPFLYNFHVFDFLLLPFIYPPKKLTGRYVADRAVRYLVPYAIFFTISCLGYLFVADRPISNERVLLYVRGLIVGSASAVDAASGFRLFWFLPALFSLVVLRSAFHSVPVTGRWLLFAATSLGFVLAGRLPRSWVDLVPLGLPIVAYCFVPGIVFEQLWKSVRQVRPSWVVVVAGAAFISLTIVAFQRGTSLVIAKLRVYSVFEPVSLVVHAAIPIASLICLLAASRWLDRGGLLALFGRFSLLVYLSHGLVYQLLLRILISADLVETPSTIAAVATYCTTLAISLMIGVAITHFELLRRMVTPRSVTDMADAFRGAAARPGKGDGGPKSRLP